MNSAARLTYEQVQAAHEAGDDQGRDLPRRCYAAFRALLAARTAPAARSTSICRNAKW